MADRKNDTQIEDGAGTGTKAGVSGAPPAVYVSEADAARARERAQLSRQLAAHDDARARVGRTILVAVTSFTIVDDENPDGRVIEIGQEFEVSLFDLPRYLGRGRLKEQDADAPATGLQITKGP